MVYVPGLIRKNTPVSTTEDMKRRVLDAKLITANLNPLLPYTVLEIPETARGLNKNGIYT